MDSIGVSIPAVAPKTSLLTSVGAVATFTESATPVGGLYLKKALAGKPVRAFFFGRGLSLS